MDVSFSTTNLIIQQPQLCFNSSDSSLSPKIRLFHSFIALLETIGQTLERLEQTLETVGQTLERLEQTLETLG